MTTPHVSAPPTTLRAVGDVPSPNTVAPSPARPGPAPATLASAPATHLALVGHVVQQLDARYPRHVDRELMWTLGAWGLVTACRRLDPRAPGFTADALRIVRDVIVDATRLGAGELRLEAADDHELADALGFTVGQLQVLRTRAVPSQRREAASHVAATRGSRRAPAAAAPAPAPSARLAAVTG